MTVPQIAWDEGMHRQYGWIVLIVFLSFGVLLNLFQIIIHLALPKLWKLPNAPIILSLAVQDGLFDFFCLISCTVSIREHRFGGESACQWQAFYAELLMAWSGLSICSLYYSCYVNIVQGHTLPHKTVFKIQIGMFLYCLLLTFLGVIYPGKGYLNSSGIFCYSAFHLLAEGILFCFGYLVPVFCALVYMNWKLEKGLTTMKKTMREYGLSIPPRPLQLNILKSMRVYVGVMLLCYSPLLSGGAYIWFTGHHPPPDLWIAIAVCGHSNTMINPVLYYLLSSSAREALFNKLFSMFGWSCLASFEISEKVEDPHAYNAYFSVMLESRAGKQVLKREAERTYCPELTKFYFDDHPRWLALCGTVAMPALEDGNRTEEGEEGEERDRDDRGDIELQPISPISLPSSSRSMSETTPVLTQTNNLDQMATYLLRTYVEDNSPLSLNIPAHLRNEIEKRLGKKSEIGMVSVSQDPNPSTIFTEAAGVIRELIFINLYKPAFHSKEVVAEFTAHQRLLKTTNYGPL